MYDLVQCALRKLVLVRSYGRECARKRFKQPFPGEHAAEVVSRHGALDVEDAANAIDSHPDEVFLLAVILVHHVDQSAETLVDAVSRYSERKIADPHDS